MHSFTDLWQILSKYLHHFHGDWSWELLILIVWQLHAGAHACFLGGKSESQLKSSERAPFVWTEKIIT